MTVRNEFLLKGYDELCNHENTLNKLNFLELNLLNVAGADK